MGGAAISRVGFNAREQVLSSDLNRIGQLTSRDLQNLLAGASADVTGVPITGLSGPSSLTGIVGTFSMALTAAQALVYNPSDSSLTADDSPYEVARWAAATLAFGTPDLSNPRIDLVVVTPAMVGTDAQARTVLVDPAARTVASQNVNKTLNPQATVTVVAGTPGASPVPPAAPAGSFALFEVYVPAGAADATAFGVVARMQRRAPFPWSTLSGIVSGFVPQWDLTVNPATTASTLSFGALDDCRVVIDGEMLETLGANLAVYQDAGSNNPFASAAPAAWHKPYYLYAVGGRHAPQLGGAFFSSPVVIVESLVAPFLTTGRPTAAITTPRGTTTQTGAVYIGIGFVAAGSTRRLPCVMDAGFTNLAGVNPLTPTNTLKHTAGSTGFEAFDVNAPAVVPVVSTRARAYTFGSGTIPTVIAPDRGDGTAPVTGYSGVGYVPLLDAPVAATARGEIPFNPASPKFWCQASVAAVTLLALTGFDHGVKRLR